MGRTARMSHARRKPKNKMTTENTDKGQAPTEADSQGHCALGDGSGFVDTTETLGWLDDDDGDNFNEWCARWWQKGFRRWPDHVPAPLDGYNFVSYGPMLYAHPPCSRWHRFLFRLPAWLAWKLYRPNVAGETARQNPKE